MTPGAEPRADMAAVALAAEAAALIGRVAALGERMAPDGDRPRVWTGERLGLLVDLWASGARWDRIAARMGLIYAAVTTRLSTLRDSRPALMETADQLRVAIGGLMRTIDRTRRCLGCHADLPETGPRVCADCRAAWAVAPAFACGETPAGGRA